MFTQNPGAFDATENSGAFDGISLQVAKLVYPCRFAEFRSDIQC
jgi:hypothetical protein